MKTAAAAAARRHGRAPHWYDTPLCVLVYVMIAVVAWQLAPHFAAQHKPQQIRPATAGDMAPITGERL